MDRRICTGARDDAQTLRILDSVQKLEIEARDKKIAAKLREAALRNDPAVAMKKIPRRATADFLWPNCHKSEDSLIFRSPPVPLDTPSC